MLKKYQLSRRYIAYIERFNNHPYAMPVTAFVVSLLLTASILIGLNATTAPPPDTHFVELSIDGAKEILPTRAETVGEFVERTDIEMEQNDVVEPEADTLIVGDDFKINVYRARPVTIEDKGKLVQAFSAATTPRSVATQAGIKVYPEDRLTAEVPEDFLREGVLGEKVIIDRATPIHLNLYGKNEPTRTHEATVGELLKSKGVNLAKNDNVQPSLATRIRPELSIFVTRQGIRIATVDEEIPMPVEYIEDSSLSFGSQAIRQQGSPGRRTVTYEIKLENGREVSRRIIQEAIITPAVKQVVARGPQGAFGEALALLRQCESSGNYAIVSSNGLYYGAYQFTRSTWDANAPPGYAGRAPNTVDPSIQDIAATTLYQRRGWQPWPACSAGLGLQDIYR